MIVKMKFVSATGPREEFDYIVDKHLSKYNLHLENAFHEFDSVGTIIPYQEINPYRDVLLEAEELITEIRCDKCSNIVELDTETAFKTVKETSAFYHSKKEKIDSLIEERRLEHLSLEKILPFKGLDYRIEKILKFEFIRYRFGRVPKPYWNNFATHFKSDLSSIFAKCLVNDEYIYGVYFVPKAEHDEVDAMYASLHFERIFIPDEYQGTPAHACKMIEGKINELTEEIDTLSKELNDQLDENRDLLYFSYKRIHAISRNFDVRKMAACTDNKNYFIVCGWMTVKDSNKLAAELESVNDCILQVDNISFDSNPPTELKNPKIFKPFELYTKMYGLPAYNEFDPTIFLALTYAFIFGAMFGDLGQGFLLFVGGLFLYKFKNFTLGAIISAAGFFSMIFGILFGSVFGFEDLIHHLWLSPIKSMTLIPGLGSLNTVFALAVGFGMFLIILTMIFNIINGIIARDIKRIFFDSNGLAGLVFYGSIIGMIVLFLTGKTLPGALVLIIMFIIPLLIIALKTPLTNLILGKKEHEKESVGMFIVEAFFELFELLLGYFSNTLSFIRIGAFAVSHAAVMEVIMLFAGAHDGSPNIIVLILGNLFIIGLEGLVVGIQVLRLEYYELFSRFYRGTGRSFKPFKS